jgi:hypothetical protein
LTTHIPKKEQPAANKQEEDECKLENIKRTRRESITPCTNESDIVSPVMRRPRHTLPDLNEKIPPPQQRQESETQLPKIKLPMILKIRYNIWVHLQYFERYEFRFALKMAVAVLVLCVPAFIPSSVTWYNGVKGQWSALTVIAIMNPTRCSFQQNTYFFSNS